MTTLAERARELAAAEPRDSLDRRAWLLRGDLLVDDPDGIRCPEALAEIGLLDVRPRAAQLLASLVTGDAA
jgi:hypothetical protein